MDSKKNLDICNNVNQVNIPLGGEGVEIEYDFLGTLGAIHQTSLICRGTDDISASFKLGEGGQLIKIYIP